MPPARHGARAAIHSARLAQAGRPQSRGSAPPAGAHVGLAAPASVAGDAAPPCDASVGLDPAPEPGAARPGERHERGHEHQAADRRGRPRTGPRRSRTARSHSRASVRRHGRARLGLVEVRPAGSRRALPACAGSAAAGPVHVERPQVRSRPGAAAPLAHRARREDVLQRDDLGLHAEHLGDVRDAA